MNIYNIVGKTQFAVNYADYIVDVFSDEIGNQVSITDDSGTDFIFESGVVKVTNSRTAEYPAHNMEDGTSITDHRYFNPNSATVAIVCSNETYSQILEAWKNSTKLTVQSKTGTMENMYITSIPSDEDVDQPDKIRLLINLTEQRFDTVEIKKLPKRAVKNPSNQSTTKRGKINKETTSDSTSQSQKTKKSVALQAFEAAFG